MNATTITRRTGYLERNKNLMPCDAMCPKLYLPNSSHLVTAKRQKHHGISWSEHGLYALTSLHALTGNDSARKWLQNRSFNLTWAAKAAESIVRGGGFADDDFSRLLYLRFISTGVYG